MLVNAHRREYGENVHPVEIPNYFSYLWETLLKPFFLLQYLVCAAFIIQRLITFAVISIFFSIFTTTINYVLSYISYKKIKEMAEKTVMVKVLRNRKMVEIPNHDLVPGDVLDPEGEVPCDCILVRGEIYVN